MDIPTKSAMTPGFLIVAALLIGLGIGAVGMSYYLKSYIGGTTSQPVVYKHSSKTTATSTSPDTAAWKTFTNSTYGFTLKIPNTWPTTKETTDDSGYTLAYGTDLNADPFTSNTNGKGQLTILGQQFGHGTPGPVVSSGSAQVGGINATKTVWQGQGAKLVEYTWQRGGKYYTMGFTSASDTLIADFGAMMASLKFTN